MQRIGIDIGRVIIGSDTDRPDLIFTNKYLEAPEVPEATVSIAQLVKHFGQQNVFLVSKCGAQVQQKSREWLKYHEFFDKTGVSPANLRFCLQRHEKRGIAKKLVLNYFVDDRYTVLKHLVGLKNIRQLYLFNADKKELASFKGSGCTDIIITSSWPQALADLGVE